MESRTFVLSNDLARKSASNSIQKAPEGYVVHIVEPTRTGAQNDLLHAALTDLGRAAGWKWKGFPVDLDDLKTIMVSAFRKMQRQGAKVLPGMDGEPLLMGWRSRDLKKSECSEVIELIYSAIDTEAFK